ncbi:MAG TPA: ABC transporter permease [Blastocatellia bacterium]|jgi:predicted permease|nr:ABC transporter permease [Blastocatellia bacterium]
MFRKILDAIRSLFQKDRMERELDQELRFHIEMEIEKNVKRGLSRKEARDAALRSFGGVERVKEECRDVRGARLIEALLQDLRYGLRILIKNPGFTVVAVLTLALGIGANTAIFSVIYGVLMRPLPYRDGGKLVHIRQQAPLARVDNMGFSVKEVLDYRDQNQTLEGVVEHHSMSFILLGLEEPQRVQTGVVSANFFDLLGVKPLLGRTFAPGDDERGAEAVLVLSYKYWQKSHGGDRNIIGKTFRMNDRVHTVIGVLPPIPQYPNEEDVYMPTSACPTRSSDSFCDNRNARMMSVFGRLKSGVPVEQAQADLSTVASNLQMQYPDSYPANRGYAAKIASLQEELTRQARPTLLILLGTAGLVLLIACANVANLTLARLMRREREMVVRAALGAGRGRLIRQLLTESTLLSLLGGVLGLLLAAGGLHLLVAFAARFTTRASEISIDASVLLFTLIISVATGLVFGLMPAFTSEKNFTAALKEGSGRSTAGAGRQRVRNALIVAQVAVSFMLLIGAGLMMRSLFKLQQVNPGYNPENVLAMRLSPNWSKYTTPQQYQEFFNRVLERVKPQPGVISASLASTYPMNPQGIANGPFNRNFLIEGRPLAEGELAPRADSRVASPEYFQTIQMPLVTGRYFTEADNNEALPVAIINQTMARHRWSDEDPVGKRVSFDRGQTWTTIVGIVGDVKQYGLDREATDEIYTPLAQNNFAGNLLVRTAADPMSMAQVMREAVYAIDPETAVDNVQTLEKVRSESLASPRLTAMLLGLFAGLALLITVAGISGVMALSVSQRTHEIGIRMALGASQGRVLAMVMRQGMTLIVVGLALGVVGALTLTGVLSALLFSVEPHDPVTFVAVSLVLIAVAALACFVPARRVTTIDPMLALRRE